MSVRRGPPKHQNQFAWKPNAGIMINETEVGGRFRPLSEITGVCPRCRDQIDWKRRYGKYKALTEPAKCQGCTKRNVRQAYHNLCHGCAKEQKVCAQCRSHVSQTVGRDISEVEEEQKTMEEAIKNARERDRRTLLRAMNPKKKGPENTLTMTEDNKVGDLFPAMSLEGYANSGRPNEKKKHEIDADSEDNKSDDSNGESEINDNEDGKLTM